jgi:ATP-binding cassette, subfamily A (ABC1), member 3
LLKRLLISFPPGAVAAVEINFKIRTAAVMACSFLFPAMNYVFCLAKMARYALALMPIEMNTAVTPLMKDSVGFWRAETYTVAVSTYWIFLAVQIVVYPFLAMLVEHFLHGISQGGRSLGGSSTSEFVAVETTGLKKVYPPSIWRKIFCCAGSTKNVTAVDGLNLVAHKNQILCLLGVK